MREETTRRHGRDDLPIVIIIYKLLEKKLNVGYTIYIYLYTFDIPVSLYIYGYLYAQASGGQRESVFRRKAVIILAACTEDARSIYVCVRRKTVICLVVISALVASTFYE